MKHSRGISLIESVVWIAVFVAAMLAITSSILLFYRSSTYAIQEAQALTSTQHAMDSVVKTIREAAYSSVGAWPIVSLATSSLTFYANIDSDSYVERVHYYLSTTTLYLGVLKPTGDPANYGGSETVTVLADYIQNNPQQVNLFTYYDGSGTQISDMTKIGDVRYVTVNITADLNPLRAPTVTTLRSSAALRNLIQ